MAWTKTPEYYSWSKMKERCLNKKHVAYNRYGGRGIVICEQWSSSFESFLKDMGPRPNNCSLDRINNDDGYFKENCRWATRKQQYANTSQCLSLTLNGETKSQKEWARLIGINHQTISERLKRGWPIEAALSKIKSNSWNGFNSRHI